MLSGGEGGEIMDDVTWFIKYGLCWLAVLGFMLLCHEWYQDEQIQKGNAISRYMLETHGIEIPPAEARFLNVNSNSYEITISELEIFAK
jgi:hypothetical protein